MGLEERRLAAEIAGLRREVRAASTTQQLGYSSIENGGRILVKDADGREVMDIGRNPDGSYGATPRIGPTRPSLRLLSWFLHLPVSRLGGRAPTWTVSSRLMTSRVLRCI